jgi:hypothetical protein
LNTAPVNEQLSGDHVWLAELVDQLQLALAGSELENTRAKLDLFWARLAVHIRAEHLHLFPAVLSSLGRKDGPPSPAPTLSEVQTVVATLQSDHDFFMSELARAVKIIRDLPAASAESRVKEALREIRHKVKPVVQRLLTHNAMEENQIYRWTSIVLTVEEQTELAQRIGAELTNRPPRFTIEAWSNVAEVNDGILK